jgi:hypothetical protein
MRSVLTFVLLSATALAHAQSTQGLFIIQRSKNKNEVHYDARFTEERALDPKEPVEAYWRMLAQDGRREKLSYFERKKAYGFSITSEPGSAAYRMTLVPARDRPIRVYLVDGKARAETVIGGRRAILRKLFISADDAALIPKVHYVELTGTDAETGQARTEKVVPR